MAEFDPFEAKLEEDPFKAELEEDPLQPRPSQSKSAAARSTQSAAARSSHRRDFECLKAVRFTETKTVDGKRVKTVNEHSHAPIPGRDF